MARPLRLGPCVCDRATHLASSKPSATTAHASRSSSTHAWSTCRTSRPRPASLPGEGRFRRRTHYITPNASGIREYAPGDPLSRIHWRSTAHTGELMVKTFELDPTSDIWVIRRPRRGRQRGERRRKHRGVHGHGRGEHCPPLHRREPHRRPDLFGEQYDLVEAERGQQQLSRILESLAVAKAKGRSAAEQPPPGGAAPLRPAHTLVIVTASTDDLWLSALQSLSQRGVRAAVVLIDPSTFGGSESPLLMFGELTASNILTYVVGQGDDLSLALGTTAVGADAWQG